MLMYGFLIALGSFTSAVAVQQGASTLLNYFDIQSAAQATEYKTRFVDYNENDSASIKEYERWLNSLTEDLYSHSIIVFAYMALALVLIEMPGYIVMEKFQSTL